MLQRTCRHYDTSLSYPNNLYGYGEVDVYAGLLDILGLSDIRDIPHEHAMARITLNGNRLHVTLPEAASTDMPLRVYDMGGRPVCHAVISSGSQSADIVLPGILSSSAIYAVCIGHTSTLVSSR